ncbi:unnamed protein product [Alternaria burnsii]|nr:unnamed protein product [Alternaria burnsii]
MTVLANLTTTWTRGSTTVTASAVDLTTYACTGTGDENDCADTTLRRLTEVTSGTAFAAQFVVDWQSSDFSRFPSEYASSLAAAIKVPFEDPVTTSPSTTSTNFVPPFTNPNNEDPDAAMSPGAIAGIAVGISAFLIFSIVLLLYLRRRMKQKQQQRLQHSDMWEMEGSSRGLKHFLGGRWRAEQDGTSQPVEAGSTSVRIIPGPPVELDTTPAERTQ